MNKREKYPLSKDYDILECPNCGKVCYPDVKTSSDSIIYNLHLCKNEYEFQGKEKRFEINANGDYIE